MLCNCERVLQHVKFFNCLYFTVVVGPLLVLDYVQPRGLSLCIDAEQAGLEKNINVIGSTENWPKQRKNEN